MLGRRHFLGLSAGLVFAPNMAFAAASTAKRLVFVIQRGAADGVGTLIPEGDRALSAARGTLMVERATKLDSLFALHPAMVEAAKMFAAKEALFAHAVATPYRDRSHFDGQNVLETGGNAAYAIKSGWMNRLVGMLPKDDSKALALAPTIPMALRGPAAVTSYAPSNLPEASADLIARVGQMYAGDPHLRELWDQAIQTRGMAGTAAELTGRDAAASGALAAKLLSGPSGARIAMIETTGWDTHAGQKARLANQLKGLDAMLAALKAGLASDWANTLVIVATEFGRTVAANGTGGTDHGTASAAMLFGGAVQGGRVIVDWPGLGGAQLYEGRDLRPTLGLDTLIASAVAQHFGLDPDQVSLTLFPDLPRLKPVERIIRV